MTKKTEPDNTEANGVTPETPEETTSETVVPETNIVEETLDQPTNDEETSRPEPASETPADIAVGDTHADDDVEELDEDVSRSSLAARVLQGLILIFIGIGLAIWGGPKLAPMLPAGLQPVAEFLMPGHSDAKAEITALRSDISDMDARLAAINTAPPENMLDQSALDAALSEYDAKITAELATLKDQLGATDGQAIEGRIAQLETKLEGVSAELQAINERMSKQPTEEGTPLSEASTTKLLALEATMDGLKAQIADLAAKNGALSQKVDEIASAANRRVEEAEAEASTTVTNTATQKQLTEIAAALETGAPFQPSLDGLTQIANITPPEALSTIAATGTPSLASLRSSFADQAVNALSVDAQDSADDSVLGTFNAFLKTQVSTRSLERKDGSDTDAILSRVEDDLNNRRLEAALKEAMSLPEGPKAAMADWIAQLDALTKAQSALAALSADLGATQ